MLKKVSSYARIGALLMIVALLVTMGGCFASPSQNLEIRTWYDLDAVRNNLGGHHTLMNDLDSTTEGYEELASATANQGKGWQPIIGTNDDAFTGSFDGQGHEIRDLFIDRPDEDFVGLFSIVGQGGDVENVGVVTATVSGNSSVGGLVGGNAGTVSNSYSTGSITGRTYYIGGLVGFNGAGTVTNSYSTGNVTGYAGVGGLTGVNAGTVSNSYSGSDVTGTGWVGGLVGVISSGTVNNSYSTGSVAGNVSAGGLVGWSETGTINNSYSTGSVTGDEEVGGLVGLTSGTATDCFWDTETSGQATSAGGTAKTTAEMQSITTFSGSDWDITAVANLSTRNPSYTWNIVGDETYPFLSWQP
jgi:hypothetical protein